MHKSQHLTSQIPSIQLGTFHKDLVFSPTNIEIYILWKSSATESATEPTAWTSKTEDFQIKFLPTSAEVSEVRLRAMQNEANDQNFYGYDPLSEHQPRSGTLWNRLSKAEQESSAAWELHWIARWSTYSHSNTNSSKLIWSHSIHLFLAGFMLRNKSLFHNCELETHV